MGSRPVFPFSRLPAALALCLALVAGCSRSCSCGGGGYWAWDPSAKTPVPTPSGSVSLPLNAFDCPDGLARCVDGVVEASRLAVIAQPCAGPPEKCQCPWDRLGGCDHGCIADGLDLVLPRAQAFMQLCAPSAADVFSRPPAAGIAMPAGLCDGALYRCVGTAVLACPGGAGDPVALATCVRGCAEEGTALDEEGLTRDQVVALLCRH